MSKKSALTTFLMGGLIGSAVALLYAPQSGEETRQKLIEEGVELRDNALKSINNLRESSLETIKNTQMQLELSAKEIAEAIKEIKATGRASNVETKRKQQLAKS